MSYPYTKEEKMVVINDMSTVELVSELQSRLGVTSRNTRTWLDGEAEIYVDKATTRDHPYSSLRNDYLYLDKIPPSQKPKTNREWLESLSDDMFAEVICSNVNCDLELDCSGGTSCDCCHFGREWLKAEHKEVSENA